jgi:hypothetical protein
VAKERSMKDVSEHKDISLSYIKVLPLIHFVNLKHEGFFLPFIVAFSQKSKDCIADGLDVESELLQQIDWVEESKCESSCDGCYVIVEDKSDQSIGSKKIIFDYDVDYHWEN